MPTDFIHSELLWAVYAFIQAAENTSNQSYIDLAKKWQAWMDYTKTTAAHVCMPSYYGPPTKEMCADFHIFYLKDLLQRCW